MMPGEDFPNESEIVNGFSSDGVLQAVQLAARLHRRSEATRKEMEERVRNSGLYRDASSTAQEAATLYELRRDPGYGHDVHEVQVVAKVLDMIEPGDAPWMDKIIVESAILPAEI